MNRNQRIKLGSVFVILILSIWLLWPTFTLFRMSTEEVEQLKINDAPHYNALLDKSLRLGLDLQGGTYLILEVDLDDIASEDHQSTVDQAIKIIRNRVDQFGVAEPSITQESGNRIVVELPGLPDVERATRLINATAQLELKLVAQRGEMLSALTGIDKVIVGKEERGGTFGDVTADADEVATETAAEAAAETDTAAADPIDFLGQDSPETGAEEGSGLLALMKGMQDGGIFIYKDDMAKVRHYLSDPDVQAAIPPGFEFLWGGRDVMDGQGYVARILYYCSSRIELQGKNLSSATSTPDNDRPGFFKVDFTLDRIGADQFARVTERNTGRQLAIVLDNQIHSAPVIQGRIGGGQANITGGFSAEEANDLAIVLKAGALPTSMHIEEERTVGPSLGRDSIEKGFKAGLIGFLCVIVFMIFYYRGSGLIATLALVFNLVIVMAAMAYLHATLTLPGIAGLILTIGMAVDANVLIYERIREELRGGGKDAKVRRAIKSGYESAFSTIIDANLTTLITALVLYIFGTGPIKGFAITLSLGIVASMYTALLVTRVIFEMLTNNRPVEKLSI